MPKARSWTDKELILAVKDSRSVRMVIEKLGLVPAGGNYVQVGYRIADLGIDTNHFKGRGWNKGLNYETSSKPDINQLLVVGSRAQSYKLKKRLFKEGLKSQKCELCGWAEQSLDGRIPVELDHINGDNKDNRINNLRILCPNCHSLQSTHRGKNKKVKLRLQ